MFRGYIHKCLHFYLLCLKKKVLILLALANNIFVCVYKVTEMEAILLQHHTAMPSRQVLEDIAEKFRCSLLLLPPSFIIGLKNTSSSCVFHHLISSLQIVGFLSGSVERKGKIIVQFKQVTTSFLYFVRSRFLTFFFSRQRVCWRFGLLMRCCCFFP